MQIVKSVEGSTLNIALEGRLDTMTAPELEAQVKDDIANVDAAVLDLAKLE